MPINLNSKLSIKYNQLEKKMKKLKKSIKSNRNQYLKLCTDNTKPKYEPRKFHRGTLPKLQ